MRDIKPNAIDGGSSNIGGEDYIEGAGEGIEQDHGTISKPGDSGPGAYGPPISL